MSRTVLFRALVGFAVAGLPLLIGSDARAEHCWDYVDGINPVTNFVRFPNFRYTKAPFSCREQGNLNASCSWQPPAACTVGGTCCTSIPNPSLQQSVLAMHEDWHTCFGAVGQNRPTEPPPYQGRSARWLAFHRQFEFDFDLMREAEFGCGPGTCVMGTCSNGANVTCVTDDQCSARDGCFIEALDWHTNMRFPYGHGGGGLQSGVHPRDCGVGPNRPGGVTCTACLPLPACLYNANAGPLNGSAPQTPDNLNCQGFQGTTLEFLPNMDVVAQILDSSHHANFHGEVGNPRSEPCNTDAECRTLMSTPDQRCDPDTLEFCPTDDVCDPNSGANCPRCVNNLCTYVEDVFAPTCSPRDPMFWRLHKRLDDTVRAWQETHPIDLSVVIDRSGSMDETDSSGAKKIEVVAEALKMIAELVPDGQSSRIGVVSYASTATPDLGLTDATTAKTAIPPLADDLDSRTGGCTSIGSGVQAAVNQLCHGVSTDPPPSQGKTSCNPNHNQIAGGGENERKGILLLTDGLENRPPCLRSTSANATSVCGDTCGGEPFDFRLLGPHTQLCAIGFGQAQSINGNLLTLVAEGQGGIYMQSPAKGPNDKDGENGTGRFVDIKDFFVKCYAQLSNEFVGIDPKGTLTADEFATPPVQYGTCDDQRLVFVGGWNRPGSGIRLLVNAPSGALVRPDNPAVEAVGKDTFAFLRAPLPLNGEHAGTWTAQLIRQHDSYVNGFTTDALPPDVAVPLVRKEIQRICPTGCSQVLYFEDGHLGPRSSYEDALAAELATGLIGEVVRATDANDFLTKLESVTPRWPLVVYAHQMTEGPEPYDLELLGAVCGGGQRAIVTETRGLDDISTPPPLGDPDFIPWNINRCAGGEPFGETNFARIDGDGRLLTGSHDLTNHGYTRFSYGQVPATLGGGTQATASYELVVGAISCEGGTPCLSEGCETPPTQDWSMNILVRGLSQLDDAVTRFNYRTGESGIQASARVLPANVPRGGYDVSDVRVEVERPTIGVGQTLLNVGQQASGATPTADGPDGRAAALAATPRIPTAIQSFVLNDRGVDGDVEPRNAYWSRTIPDSDTPGQCLVDGMYKLHFTANFTKNGCTTRRELVRSTFVDVGVDTRVSNMVVTPQLNGMTVNICPQDRCGNKSGWGRRISCNPSPGCSCGPSDIADHGDGCYTIRVHSSPGAATCTIDGTGKPIDVAVPVVANAGPDQMLQCAGGGANAQLDGRQSSDANGAQLTFLWTAPGITFNNPASPTPTARFPIGTTVVTLTVTSPNGGSATDTVLITVVDTQPPVLVVPPDITISVCNNPNIGNATATDTCGGQVTLTNDKPSRFPLGTTVVTYFAVDRFGNATSATQRVTAVLGDDTSCCPSGTTIRVGTPNNDNLTGTSGSDCILGRGAQDTINGLGGNDFISGGEGDDIIDGGSGNDQLFGGNGQDTLRGGTGNDILDGLGGDDQCFGGDNDDVIRGGQGQDRLFGENGNDQLFGNDGDDRLEGGAGNDALDGGGLHDICLGGPGTDTFASCQTVQQ